MPWLAVIFSAPRGESWTFLSASSAAARRPRTSVTAVNNSSPSSVSVRPRAWRWKSGVEISSSSALIWRLTADCDRPRVWPAWVKLPADATAWKMRSLSQSMTGALLGLRTQRQIAGMAAGQEAFGFQRRHAAHTRRRHRLAENLVLDVTGREHARHRGMRGVRRRLDIAALVHVELALEQAGGRRMADGNEQAVHRLLMQRAGDSVPQA